MPHNVSLFLGTKSALRIIRNFKVKKGSSELSWISRTKKGHANYHEFQGQTDASRSTMDLCIKLLFSLGTIYSNKEPPSFVLTIKCSSLITINCIKPQNILKTKTTKVCVVNYVFNMLEWRCAVELMCYVLHHE